MPQRSIVIGEKRLECRDRYQDEAATRRPPADHFAQQRAAVGNVLDDVEGEDEVEAAFADGMIGPIALDNVVVHGGDAAGAVREVEVDCNQDARVEPGAQRFAHEPVATTDVENRVDPSTAAVKDRAKRTHARDLPRMPLAVPRTLLAEVQGTDRILRLSDWHPNR